MHYHFLVALGVFDLAAEWAGFKTSAFVENNKFCQQVLAKHWKGVPIYGDIKGVTVDVLAEGGIEPGSIGLIHGGFPYQPFSRAGKRGGAGDDRYLWPEMLRVIREVRPAWVCGENVSGIISMALDRVCLDLEAEGYEVQPLVFPACGVGAYHKRERVFIVAHSNSKLNTRPKFRNAYAEETSGGFTPELNRPSEAPPFKRPFGGESGSVRNQWSVEPRLGRVANGVPHRLDRLRALGNAVVPQQAYPIFKAIAEAEGML